MTNTSKDPYYTLESVAPKVFGYYSAIHFVDEKSFINPKKQGSNPTTIGKLEVHRLSSGGELTVSSSGIIFVDLSNDSGFKEVIFPSRETMQSRKGKYTHEEEKAKNSQNRRLARLILRTHQAFLESAVHITGSGGAKANSIDSFYDIADVHSANELLRHPRLELQLNSTRHFSDMSWGVAKVAFRELEIAHSTGGIELLKLIELYQISCRRFQTHEYEQTIFLCWMVCESILSHLWEHHLKRIFKDLGREADLSNARLLKLNRTPESLMIELLEAYGSITPERMNELKTLKNTRNKVVHELDEVSLRQANQAIVCSKDLFYEVYGVKLTVMISHPEWHGGRWIR